MSENTDRLMAGMGRTCHVAAALLDYYKDDNVLHTTITRVYNGLRQLDETDSSGKVWKQLLCSCANGDFRATGWLWSVDNDGLISREHITSESTVAAVAAALEL